MCPEGQPVSRVTACIHRDSLHSWAQHMSRGTGDIHGHSVPLGDTLPLEGHNTPGDSTCPEGEQVPERTERMFAEGQHMSIRTGAA